MEKVREIAVVIGLMVLSVFCFGNTSARMPLRETAERSEDLPVLDENSSLADYLSYAALNNPALEAAFNDWKADAQRVKVASSLDDPRFEYKYYIEEVETRVGPQRQSIGISQSLPWFGTLELKGQIADEKAQSSAQKYEAAKLALFYEVSEAYYEYYYLGQAIATTKDNISLLKNIEDVALAKYKVSQSSQPDLIRIQVEVLKLDDRLAELKDLQTTHVARLNAALNRASDARLAIPRSIELNNIQISDEQVIGMAQSTNPALRSLDYDIKGAQQGIELAKKAYWPNFNFGISMIDTSDSTVGNPSDNGKDPVIASVSLTIPLWQGKYSAGEREARNRYFAAANRKFDAVNMLDSKLKTALYKYRDADRKIELYGKSLLPKAQQSLDVTGSDFRAGKADFTAFIDSQRILLEFSLSYKRAIADKAIAVAKIEMLSGGEVPLEAVESK